MAENTLLNRTKYGLISEPGVASICKMIEDITAEIHDELGEISRLVELLPNAYNDDNTKKFCELFEEQQLVKLNKYCDKCTNIKVVLEKMMRAYRMTDEKYAKTILNN